MEFHKILIAIDNKPSSEIVAKSGLQLAKQYNSAVALISIIDADHQEDEDPASRRELEDMMEHNLNRSQLHVIEKIFKDFPVKSFVETGRPSKGIIKTALAWGADIIVMGTHGRQGWPHIVLGSVAEEVIRNSKKTVVVIPVND